jgi:hypothetical protein
MEIRWLGQVELQSLFLPFPCPYALRVKLFNLQGRI